MNTTQPAPISSRATYGDLRLRPPTVTRTRHGRPGAEPAERRRMIQTLTRRALTQARGR